jgi:hypothetical protein
LIPSGTDPVSSKVIGAVPIHFFSRLLIAAYLIEAGLLLIMAPWSLLWERNYFGDLWPMLDAVMENLYVRGGVTGVGVVTAWAGVRDLIATMVARWSNDSDARH